MATSATVHTHAAPTGFIRKYIFSLDHKVIGLQYYFLALVAVFVGMFLSLLMRIHLIWPGAALPILGEIKPDVPHAGHHARHDYGFLRAYHGAAGRLWQLLPADSDRGAGHGFPRFEHALVLDDFARLHRDDRGLLCRGWRAAAWLDRLRAAERTAIRGAR